MEVTVEADTDGSAVKIENPNPHAGAIIPFASGDAILIDTRTVGTRNTAAVVGYGNRASLSVAPEPDAAITLSESIFAFGHFAFSMLSSGKITSIAAYCSIYAGGVGTTPENVVTAQLYASDTEDNIFRPLLDVAV